MPEQQSAPDFVENEYNPLELTEEEENRRILQGIKKGQEDIEAGRFVDHETAKKMSEEWISQSSGRIRP